MDEDDLGGFPVNLLYFMVLDQSVNNTWKKNPGGLYSTFGKRKPSRKTNGGFINDMKKTWDNLNQEAIHKSIPCCLNNPPLLHRDKISRNYSTKISLLYKNQEFSYASFPHVFKTIGPLEKILETKNHFFVPFKKVAFSVSRIINAKTIKSYFFSFIFQTLILYGENRYS